MKSWNKLVTERGRWLQFYQRSIDRTGQIHWMYEEQLNDEKLTPNLIIKSYDICVLLQSSKPSLSIFSKLVWTATFENLCCFVLFLEAQAYNT